jgi:nucleotide-binding universal stress UspA family protein
MTLARQQAAHVTGLSLGVMPSRPSFVYHPSLSEVLVAQEESLLKEAEARAKTFREAIDLAGIFGECRVQSCLDLEYTSTISLNARYADLVIMGQAEPEEADSARRHLPEHVVLEAGRPVLVVPYIGLQKSLGERMVIAWDGGREAARAVADALPLLERAQQVEVVVVDPERDPTSHGREPGADIAQFLARHGCKVEVQRLSSSELSVGDRLLSHMADCDADLLVMGGYAHARLRQLVLGGTTQQILQQMTVPVLLSH